MQVDESGRNRLETSRQYYNLSCGKRLVSLCTNSKRRMIRRKIGLDDLKLSVPPAGTWHFARRLPWYLCCCPLMLMTLNVLVLLRSPGEDWGSRNPITGPRMGGAPREQSVPPFSFPLKAVEQCLSSTEEETAKCRPTAFTSQARSTAIDIHLASTPLSSVLVYSPLLLPHPALSSPTPYTL